MHKTKYGYFDTETNEYVITNPLTPRSWENRIWNKKLLLQITNHGTGIGYEKDGQGRFILYNFSGNRFLYIYDLDKKCCWSPAWYPLKTRLTQYEARHGLNYTIIKGSKNNIEVTWSVTVDPEQATEIWHIDVFNNSRRKRNILLVPVTELDLSFKDPYFGPVNLFKTDYSSRSNFLFVKNYSYRCDANDYALGFTSNKKITRFETDKDIFLKEYSTYVNPATILKDDFRNSLVSGNKTPLFAVRYSLSLKGRQHNRVETAMFTASSSKQAQQQAQQIKKTGSFNKAMHRHKQFYNQLVNSNTVLSRDKDMDNFVNVWTKNQLLFNAYWNRGWQMGFRDCMQDMDIYRIFDTDYVRARILDATRHIYRDGHTVRKWASVDTKKYFDGGIWYINTIVNYIKETGDFDLLNIEEPYFDKGSGSILEHMKQTVAFLDKQRGPDNICRMGFGDWNDALNGVDRQGKGESVWTTMAYMWALQSFIDLLAYLQDKDNKRYQRISNKLKKTLNRSFWEKGRYIRAVTDDGTRLGSPSAKAGKIFLNPQSWAILSDTASPERCTEMLANVRRHLYTDYGCVLLTPAYTEFNENIGRISGDLPGFVENGANYVHACIFYAYALVKAELPDEAWEILHKIMPSNPKNPPEVSRVEPFTITNCIFGPGSGAEGQAMFPWRTGSAGWYLKVIWDGFIGIIPDYENVKINARIPRALGKTVRVRRYIRSTAINFIFTRTTGSGLKYDIIVENNSTVDYLELTEGKTVLVKL